MKHEGRIPEVDTFADMMQYELDDPQNQDKGGWGDTDPFLLLAEVQYHVGKLSKAVMVGDVDGIAEYAADTGNLCMMLADRCGVLALRNTRKTFAESDYFSEDW